MPQTATFQICVKIFPLECSSIGFSNTVLQLTLESWDLYEQVHVVLQNSLAIYYIQQNNFLPCIRLSEMFSFKIKIRIYCQRYRQGKSVNRQMKKKFPCDLPSAKQTSYTMDTCSTILIIGFAPPAAALIFLVIGLVYSDRMNSDIPRGVSKSGKLHSSCLFVGMAIVDQQDWSSLCFFNGIVFD